MVRIGRLASFQETRADNEGDRVLDKFYLLCSDSAQQALVL